MAEPIKCPHCGNTEKFDEKILQVIFVPYNWNKKEGQYRQGKDLYGDAESEGLVCGCCERETPFEWLDLRTENHGL